MKKIFFFFVHIVNRLVLLSVTGLKITKSRIYMLNIRVTNKNQLKFFQCNIRRSSIAVMGNGNQIVASNSLISDSTITVEGMNNRVYLKDGVKLRKGLIQIRGNGCTIEIDEDTSFGQIRIVNVGKNNSVSIGKKCLFADDIEIWASDTHSIYDENGNFINPEKPVQIGDKVWIGSHVRILKGVAIGDEAIVGMNSVITKNIAPKTLNAGNPIKVLKSNISWSLNYENFPS